MLTKHPFYLAWIVLTMGTFGYTNIRGVSMLPLTSAAGHSSSSGGSSFFGGWRSFGSGGGSFHK